ncbi:unnamed protein product [Albugo candida]|uniref:CBM20 domain-containing protein n=2 Tax=Albugo candida TaxID=65357 RepID=A0A024FYM4_9STRA|nr:unnamed protein product [Albugo candida]|eukprot:CCI39611.1 unnamed protein product [Albugo candida]
MIMNGDCIENLSDEADSKRGEVVEKLVSDQMEPSLSIQSAGEGLYPCKFHWSQPDASSVGITGTFNNWGSQIPLHRNTTKFEITLFLPAGIHFFKYCVDGAWKYDPEIVFAPDQFGNLNNFIRVENAFSQGESTALQTPIKTILRDGLKLPTMNPQATEELFKVRAELSSSPDDYLQSTESTSTALNDLPSINLAAPQPTDTNEDSEYGLPIDEKTLVGTNGTSTPTQAVVTAASSAGRSRSGTMTRSKSEQTLAAMAAIDDDSDITSPATTRRYSRYLESVISSSVLLAATTQHFGGDLVTHEHNRRAQKGGHRSYIAVPQDSDKQTRNRSAGKLMLFLVGLPGRGKTFIGHILARHLTWMGHQSKVFNAGEYRRKIVGSNINHAFWDPQNEEMYQKRLEIINCCLEDAISELNHEECHCVIFDATNATVERRNILRDQVAQKTTCEMLFIESVCDSVELLKTTINDMKLNSADYASQTLEEAAVDYYHRIAHYQDSYESMNADKEDVPFIKVIDVGRQIFCNQVYGYLQSRIMFLLANLQLRPRPIWLTRHGESMFNTQKRIGGDSPLSPLGLQYAMQLDRFINTYYPTPNTNLSVWTSTMLRTGMTVERIAARGRAVVKWKQLDEIDAGICDGMTYEQVAEEMPEEYLARKNNKLHYRYPRGESYQDVIHRLEPVITELMRMDQPVLIVAHQAILRVLYAYLTNKDPSECPTINIPLHVVIQVTPKAYQCEEVWHHPM